ncbi:hypothetical protein GCM10010442_66720 [Kitasatospora kifunensis]|uniref:Uncharacterized protein n=1 Tax=Kitasatospora kifunensis TaxID=58351 RepID=A0A7W7RBV8_KITKI|nr:hypothetical protein [Kitasatospora kifunensis]
MTDAVGELCGLPHSLSEAERFTLLGEPGVGRGARPAASAERPVTRSPGVPLLVPRVTDGIVSEIEWV